MIIPNEAFKIDFNHKIDSPGICKITGLGGLPNIDDGYYQGIPLGGFGAGVISHNFRGDFCTFNLDIGKHNYHIEPSCQFGIYEDSQAFILNGNKPKDVLSSWNFKSQNGSYSAFYPTAYFEYKDLNITLEEFSPIIANNYEETSYPVAVFNFEITNTKNTQRDLSLFFSFKSPFGSNKNYFYQESSFCGIIFDNLQQALSKSHGQFGMFVEKSEEIEVSYISSFDGEGDGLDVWKNFSKIGRLQETGKLLKNAPGALSAKISIPPNSKKKITFSLAWDFPIYQSGAGTKWFKKYTNFFGKDGRNIIKIARKTYGDYERWKLFIFKWQNEILNEEKIASLPQWFKTMLMNELYYIALGGTIWTTGKIIDEKKKLIKQEEHFGILECFDYPFYETLDVRFYGSFPVLKLWTELEKLVLNDYVKSITYEDKEIKHFDHPLAPSDGERKRFGAAPHDLGSPKEDPFKKLNAYPHVDISKWKDLNSKFILQIYRYFYFTKDKKFLETSWESIEVAIKYLKAFDRDNDGLIENENIPDQTFDNWSLSGPSTYCNGLWLAALLSVIEITKILGKDFTLYKSWFDEGQKNLELKLSNEEYYLLDTNPENKNILMADALCGQWYADLLGLGDVFNKDRVDKTLRNIFRLNVSSVGNGKTGAINGINFNGNILPESKIWKENTQWNEVWAGVTFALSSLMLKRGMEKEALATAFGIYDVVYVKKGYFFRTPEAWNTNGDFRASMYHRPGAVWAFGF